MLWLVNGYRQLWGTECSLACRSSLFSSLSASFVWRTANWYSSVKVGRLRGLQLRKASSAEVKILLGGCADEAL